MDEVMLKNLDIGAVGVTPFGYWTAWGFVSSDDINTGKIKNIDDIKFRTLYNKQTNLKLGTVLEFQRLIREYIKAVVEKVDNPELVADIEQINYIYIELLEHV